MRISLIALSLLLLNACSSWSSQRPNETNISGAGSLIQEEAGLFSFGSNSYSTIDYCQLLHSYGIATDPGVDKESSDLCLIPQDRLINLNSRIRNEVQDHLIAASNQKCGDYIRLLHSLRGDTDVFWGGLTTLLAGAGSVLSHAETAKAFSVGGAVSSGIRSEFSQAYFANLAIEVMVSGINSKRATILTDINSRRADTATDYTLNGAVRDALLYHGSCNAVTGMEVAGQSITRADNPGAKELSRFIDDLTKNGLSVRINSGGPTNDNGGTDGDGNGDGDADGNDDGNADGNANANGAAGGNGVVPNVDIQ